MQHLTGARKDCSDVIGVYPMLPDETCNFLVFDFDNHDDTTNGDDYANTDELWREDVSGQVHLVLANGIYVEKENLQPRLQNTLRRMAAYSNPQYYKNHAMGFSNRDNPRIVACFEEFDDYISISRGLREILSKKLKEAEIPYEVSDERQKGKSICVDFSAELYLEQRKASEQMLRYENGILHAATAFGKTAVGAYLIAARKTNTLILVHNKEIMNNWVEDLQKFLDINEEPPEYTTLKGRVKRRKSVIGTRYAGHDSMTGIIDVVMISSLGKPGNIDTVVKDYGMVLIDECHHCASDTAEAVVKEVSARYVYGLTATPKRDDGQEQKIFMQIGPVRYRFSAKDKVKLQGIAHYVYPRFTRLINTTGQDWKIHEAYAAVRGSDVRNRQIISDVEECLRQGRTPLVLTKFRDHADILLAMLRDKADHVFLLKGGRSHRTIYRRRF